MSKELYLNDILIELPPKAISQTLQINDLAEIKDRNANYTGNIKIPMTPKNIIALELLGITGNTTRVQYDTLSVKYVVNGIELITGGKGLVKNTNDGYNLIIYDGNIELSDLIGNKLLRTLDFSAHNHSLTETIYTDSWAKTDGYIYPLGAYYELSSLANNNPFTIDVSTPMFFMHTLFDMIFTQEAFTVTGDIFTDTEFKDRVISMDKGYVRETTNSKLQVFFRSTVLDAEVDDSIAYVGIGVEKTYTKASFTITASSSYTVNCIGSVDIVFGLNPRLVVLVNGGQRNEFPFTNGQQFNFDAEMNLNVGDLIEVAIKIFEQEFSEFNKVKFTTLFNITIFKNTLSIPIDFGEIIGDMTRKEFVKDIMQHYGLIFRKVRNENTFEFKQIKTILVDRANAENWSDKFDGFKDEKYKPPFAKNNHAKFSYDDIGQSNIEQTYADGTFILNNARLQQEKTLFTTMFKAGVLDNNFYRHKHWSDEEGVITINSDSNRIYRILKVTDTVKYRFSIESNSFSTITGTTAKLYFVNYQEDLNDHYREYRQVLEDFKDITLSVNLSVLDIYNIDFFKLKYFDQLGRYYFMNKVSNFKPNKITKVQMFQIGADVVEGISGIASYAGSSTYTADLSKNAFGEMIGSYSGDSNYIATLRKNDPIRFGIGTIGRFSSSEACTDTSLEDNWHNGTGFNPDVNDTIFTDSAGTITKSGSNFWYKMATTHSIRVDNNGIVTTKVLCV